MSYSFYHRNVIVMKILLFLFFTNQVFDVSGKLTVIREVTNSEERNLTCLSEDDGSALVWNGVFSKELFKKSDESMKFYNAGKNIPSKNTLDCKMVKENDCWKSWTIENWNLTDSLVTFLGPVLDRRWEEFHENGTYTVQNTLIQLKNAKVFSFSIRCVASDEFRLLLCQTLDYPTTFCYWIIIGGNGKSSIRKCSHGIPLSWDVIDDECRDQQAFYDHNPLSSYEWRTFLVMFDYMARNISVYEAATNTVFLRYQDSEQTDIFDGYYMFFNTIGPAFYRFHIYTFLHATVENATITSPIFQVYNRTICQELLIGLCAECSLDIVLYNAAHEIKLKTLTIKGSSKAHGLPMWQFATIEHFTDDDSAIMELITKLNSNTVNPLWAIANVRQCPKPGSYRKSILNTTMRNVTCQKLLYDDQAVVSAEPRTTLDIKIDNPECPEGKIGPNCLEICKPTDNENNECIGTAICYEDGCTCFPGFIGPDCLQPCQRNTYGHGCKKICGSCISKEYDSSLCNKINGTCNYGCRQNNPEELYIPPFCQKRIDKPKAPILNIMGTSVEVEVSLMEMWKIEEVSYAFIIKEMAGVDIIDRKWKPIFRNMTRLKVFVQNLKPGAIYHFAYELRYCTQRFDGVCNTIQSEWHSAEIPCIQTEDFALTIQNHTLLIDARHSNLSYSCPANWYKLTIHHTNTDAVILQTLIDKFPYELTLLPSYTTITVTILHEYKKIFSEELRTSKEVPSKIKNLQVLFLSNTSVTLTWIPISLTGKIEWYNVTLQIKEYRGCKHHKSTQQPLPKIYSTNDTTITIQNLHPYAVYSAQVVAQNSRYASAPVDTIFATKQSDIVTEIYRHFTVRGWNMTWQPPADCRTITGKLYARIHICGVNDKNFHTTKETTHYHLSLLDMKLHHAELYVATLSIMRHAKGLENPSTNQDLAFETPPGVPPRVTNLEIYETDTLKNCILVHLRWQPPIPPHNGTLRIYRIRSCETTNNKCNTTEVQLTAKCHLWDDYICGSIEAFNNNQIIEVVAYNIDVPEPGVPSKVSMTTLHNAIPDGPGNFSVTVHKHGIVDLEWFHPWKTGNPLECFHIRIYLISTNLETVRQDEVFKNRDVNFQIEAYSPSYRKRLYLFPSTRYLANIQAITEEDRKSKPVYKLFETPSSLMFSDQLKYKVYDSDSTIFLYIPPVLHNIRDSMLNVIIKARRDFKLCEGYSKVPKKLQMQADINVNDVAWLAAEGPLNITTGKPFMLGDNRLYGKAKNCPLQCEQLYEITVIVTHWRENLSNEPIMLKTSIFLGKISTTHYEKWLVPVMVIVGAAIAFYFYQRKCRIMRKKRTRPRRQRTEEPKLESPTYEEIALAHL